MAALIVIVGQAQAQPPTAIREEGNVSAAVALAAKLASVNIEEASEDVKRGLRASYVAAYGNIDTVPSAWYVLMRRTLVCQVLHDNACLQSSFAAINKIGGLAALEAKVPRLLEVSNFRVAPGIIVARLKLAEAQLSLNIESERKAVLESTVKLDVVSDDLIPAAKTSTSVKVDVATTPTTPTSLPKVQNQQDKTNTDKPVNASVKTNEWLVLVAYIVSAQLIVILAYLFYRRRKRISEFTFEQNEAVAQSMPRAQPSPKEVSSRQLLVAIHGAESDIFWIMEHYPEAEKEGGLAKQFDTIHTWANSLREARSTMLADFEERGWNATLDKVDEPESLNHAFVRLIDHAAFFSTLLFIQNKVDSGMYYWSKQLPTSLLEIIWNKKTSAIFTQLQGRSTLEIAAGRAPSRS